MFKKPYMTIAKQLELLLTGETVLHDTDFRDCDVYTIGCFEDELHIDTPDGHRFLLTISEIETDQD